MITSIFAVYLLGAFVQTFPVGILVYAAFSDENFSLGRTVACRKLAVICGLGSLMFAGIACILYHFIGTVDFFQGTMLMLLFTAFLLCFIWKSLIAGKKAKLLALIIAVHYETIIVTVSSMIMAQDWILRWENLEGIPCYQPLAPLTLFLLTIVTWPFIKWFYSNPFRNFIAVMEEPVLKRACIYISLAMGTTFLGVGYFIHFEVSYSLAVLLLSLTSNSLTYFMFIQETQHAREAELLTRQMELLEVQYRQISRHIQEVTRLRHDIRHHLNTISVLNAEGKQEEIAGYLREYQVSYEKTEAISVSGYGLVDSILNYYLSKAEERKITVMLQNYLKKSYPFSSTDMTVLLGNCLENALEACEESGCPDPAIQVELQVVNSAFLIRISNTMKRQEGPDSGFTEYHPITSTKGGERGWGLSSAQQIAKKYKGSLEIRQKEQLFTVRILLNIPE